MHRQAIYRLFLTLTILEGLLALYFVFRIPSQENNAFIFGYSPLRLALGGLAGGMLLALLGITLRAWLDAAWLERITVSIEEYLKGQGRLLRLTTSLVFGILTILGLLALFTSPAAGNMHTLKAVYERSVSLLIWLAVVMAQALLALLLTCSETCHRKGFLNWGQVWQTLLVSSIFAATIFHWAILLTQDALFVAIEGWFWQFRTQDIGLKEGLLLLSLIPVTIAVAALIFKRPQQRVRNLILLLALGYGLQISFGFASGGGFEALRLKFADSFHRGFAEHASDNPSALTALRNYEAIYGPDINLGTKPPGALLFYIAAQKASNLVNPAAGFSGRYQRLTEFSAYVFPLLAALAALPLLRFSRSFLSETEAYLPAILLFTCPSFLLFPLATDQFLFPLLFISGLFLLLRALEKQSPALALAAGAFIYFAIFISFSLLPLAAIAGLWVLFDGWLRRKEVNPWSVVRLLLGLAAGLLLTYLAFRFLLNYDFFLRYAGAFARHRAHKEYQSDLEGILIALLINNFEFAFSIGVPLALLALGRAARAAAVFIQNKAARLDGLLAACVITYLFLNLFGQTRSEVGRLWLFLLPLAALFAAPEARALFERQKASIYLVIGLQLATTILTFLFQDYYY